MGLSLKARVLRVVAENEHLTCCVLQGEDTHIIITADEGYTLRLPGLTPDMCGRWSTCIDPNRPTAAWRSALDLVQAGTEPWVDVHIRTIHGGTMIEISDSPHESRYTAIREANPGCVVDHVLSDKEYHS